jgi:hypothetical protein
MSKTKASDSLSCRLVVRLITDWAMEEDRRPFPLLQVGDHLTKCLSCLVWSTELAYHPADRYLRALHLRLRDLLAYLAESLVAVWTRDPDVRCVFTEEPGDLADHQEKVRDFLRRYESFGPKTSGEARQMKAMLPDSPSENLTPYELIRYYYHTALQMAPKVRRLGLLVNLGNVEGYRASCEQRAGHIEQANSHFQQARDYFGQVMTVDVRSYKGTAAKTAKVDKSALACARFGLAGIEVLQGQRSEVAWHKAIVLLLEAKRLAEALDLSMVHHAMVGTALLIAYLRLFLDYRLQPGYEQARQLAQEICASPELGPALLKHKLSFSDPELIELLRDERVKELADYLNQQAQKQLAASD